MIAVLLLVTLELTAEERTAIYSLLGVIFSVAGSVIVNRLSTRAAARQAAADRDVTGGRLALNIANRAERRIKAIEEWRQQVAEEWWPQHEEWDRARTDQIRRVNPRAVIPPPPRLPRYVPFVEDEDVA